MKTCTLLPSVNPMMGNPYLTLMMLVLIYSCLCFEETEIGSWDSALLWLIPVRIWWIFSASTSLTLWTKASKIILLWFFYCSSNLLKQWNSLLIAVKCTFKIWFLGGKDSFAFQNKKAQNADRQAYIQTAGMCMSDVGSGLSSKVQSSVLFNISFIFWRCVLWLFQLCIFLATLWLFQVNTSTNHVLEQDKLLVMYVAKPSFKSFVKAPIEALCRIATRQCSAASAEASFFLLTFPTRVKSCLPHSLINSGLFNKLTQSI